MSRISQIKAIVTHPGGAHKDELLACSVLLAEHPVPIYRREPTGADLENPHLAVIDVGHRHEPDKLNFDHHQFSPEAAPRCALSLVLDHLGLYEDARRFCPWLESAEWFDCRGAQSTARMLGTDPELLEKLVSPIDITVLRRFARQDQVLPGDPLWEVMRWIGEDLLHYLRNLRERMEYLNQHARLWTFSAVEDSTAVLFLPRIEPLPPEPAEGIVQFVRCRYADAGVRALVYPDRRGDGFALARFDDAPDFAFDRIAEEPDVHFAHARGFVAKTSALCEQRLRALLQKARIA